MYEMFSGRRLFSEMTDAEVCQMRQGGDVLICDDCGIPKSLRKLINRCWLLSPKHRPSFKGIAYAHVFQHSYRFRVVCTYSLTFTRSRTHTTHIPHTLMLFCFDFAEITHILDKQLKKLDRCA